MLFVLIVMEICVHEDMFSMGTENRLLGEPVEVEK